MINQYVNTILEQILFEFARLLAAELEEGADSTLVAERFRMLRSGRITISQTIRQWEGANTLNGACVFCGSAEHVHTDYLIPRSRGGEAVVENRIHVCESCRASRGDRGIYEWLGIEQASRLDRVVIGQYLRLLIMRHVSARTLNTSRHTLHRLCERCPMGSCCEERKSVGQLTDYCLESVLPRHM